MSRIAKIAVAVAVVVLLPVGAYAVGNLTAPVKQPAPPREIQITEAPAPTPAGPTARPGKDRGDDEKPRKGDRRDRDDRDDRDDDVQVVTPRPAPVDDDDDDDHGDDHGDDDGDERHGNRDDGDDDHGDDDD
jgi:hypothetical protein